MGMFEITPLLDTGDIKVKKLKDADMCPFSASENSEVNHSIIIIGKYENEDGVIDAGHVSCG